MPSRHRAPLDSTIETCILLFLESHGVAPFTRLQVHRGQKYRCTARRGPHYSAVARSFSYAVSLLLLRSFAEASSPPPLSLPEIDPAFLRRLSFCLTLPPRARCPDTPHRIAPP